MKGESGGEHKEENKGNGGGGAREDQIDSSINCGLAVIGGNGGHDDRALSPKSWPNQAMSMTAIFFFAENEFHQVRDY